MSIFIIIILLAFAFILLAVSGGFITNAAVRITGIPEYSDNTDLKSAHKWASWAAVTAWITVALIIFSAILYYAFGAEETLGMFTKFVLYGLFFLDIVAVIIVGIFAALTASDINKSKVTDNNLAYRQSIVATVTAIVGFVFLVAGLIFVWTRKPKTGDSSLSTLAAEAELGEV